MDHRQPSLFYPRKLSFSVRVTHNGSNPSGNSSRLHFISVLASKDQSLFISTGKSVAAGDQCFSVPKSSCKLDPDENCLTGIFPGKWLCVGELRTATDCALPALWLEDFVPMAAPSSPLKFFGKRKKKKGQIV